MNEFTVKIDSGELSEKLDRIDAKMNLILAKMEEVITVVPTIPVSEKPLNYLTLEDFGGDGYYKRIDSGLAYYGNVITSDTPIFTQEDLGKSFCGLFAHKSPSEIDLKKVDEFYPNILGSRYSKIIEVIDSKTIKVDFEYNNTSGKGYVFFDNSEAYDKLMDAYISDNSVGIWLSENKTYVVVQTTDKKLPDHKDFIIKTSDTGKAYLKLGIEDYFQWNKKIGTSIYKNAPYLFQIGVSDKNFISKNICYLPPQRRVAEAQATGMGLFGGSTGNIGEQKRTLSIVGNTALDEMRSIGSNITEEIFSGIGLGFLYAGGTYTKSRWKIQRTK